MLAKRIIPCLDVKAGNVVKGVQFRDHKIVGDIVTLAKRYQQAGADELVFYDITASSEDRSAAITWVTHVAKVLDIPFCVAGGIRDLETARAILHAGADKISINSPALENPALIDTLAQVFGRQCVVVGIDSYEENGDYYVYQYTGSEKTIQATQRRTLAWIEEVQARGAGEIVLNCMNQDGMRQGYDIKQLQRARAITTIPLIASGGAGEMVHFSEVFQQADVNGALAASVFHTDHIPIPTVKIFLKQQAIEVRL